MTYSFQNGLALCAIIHRYRPDLVDFQVTRLNNIFKKSLKITDLFQALDSCTWAENNQLAFDLLDTDLGIPPVMSGQELATSKNPDKLTMISYLSQVYELFRKDIPAVKQPKLENAEAASDEDDEYLHNHPKPKKTSKYHENGKVSIGQLVASDMGHKKKKRRSKETEEDNLNKENILETMRLNKSAQRKRIQKLLEKGILGDGEEDGKKGRRYVETGSIKNEERYRIIAEQFAGGPKRRSGGHSKEEKKPKDLKRAIGKLDKEDWNIKNIEDKMVAKSKKEGKNYF